MPCVNVKPWVPKHTAQKPMVFNYISMCKKGPWTKLFVRLTYRKSYFIRKCLMNVLHLSFVMIYCVCVTIWIAEMTPKCHVSMQTHLICSWHKLHQYQTWTMCVACQLQYNLSRLITSGKSHNGLIIAKSNNDSMVKLCHLITRNVRDENVHKCYLRMNYILRC